MSGKNTIDHLGFVSSVEDGKAVISINSQSACAACHAKGACTAADQEEKVLTVSTGDYDVVPGEQVKVVISRRTGLRAVAFGYVYPFLLIMVVLIGMTAAGKPELQAGLWSLIVLPVYYLLVYLFRNKIGNSFSFRMVKINTAI